ncbi:ABC transporter permease subunit [Micromonospora sp. CPCC 206061]|uniref:ABC transporter permease subunit n=1 Tax=Micromonospora sp. CPCC 206061 TaxID=3122410 RepID=UPI002FF1883E
MNLVRAEVSRLLARRFTQLMLVLLVGAFVVTIATTLASSHRPTAAEWERAEFQVVQEESRHEEMREHCESGRGTTDFCQALSERKPRLEDYLFGVFVFEREIRALVYFMAAFLALFGFLVAASFIGAELNSGGMTNLLLWRPQRLTVLGTKLGTMLGGVLAVALVATIGYIASFWVIAQANGLPGDVDAEFWGDLTMVVVRGLLLVLGAAALGFCLATLGRHTAAAMGVVAGYAIVWEVGARIVMEVVETDRAETFMLSTYLGAWMDGRVTFYDGPCMGSFAECSYSLTWAHGMIVLSALVAVVAVGAFASFRQRDLA